MKERANIGLGKAISYFLDMGYNVSIPITDTQRYDLVVEFEGSLARVECKTTDYKSEYGIPVVSVKTCGGNRSGQTIKKISEDEADLLFAYDIGSDSCWVIPVSVIHGMTSLSLGKKYEDYKAR